MTGVEMAPEIKTVTLPDGYRSFVRLWAVPAPKARVVVLHGIVSHGGWYLASCQHLAAAGCEVHLLERRGSGLNSPARGDVAEREVWLTDLDAYLAALPEGPRPVLLGISWGGKLAAAFARFRPESLAGFGMICPGLFAYQQASVLQRAGIRLGVRSGLGDWRVPIPLDDAALFTDSERWQGMIRQDPFRLRRMTLRFAAADLELNRYATEAPEEILTPALLVLAGQDRICDNLRTRVFFERLGGEQRTLFTYPEAAHTLEFEPEPQGSFNDLAGWVLGLNAHHDSSAI